MILPEKQGERKTKMSPEAFIYLTCILYKEFKFYL